MTSEALLDEIALRRASIADAQRERADGELDDSALAVLVAREEAAIARCVERLRTEASSQAELRRAVHTRRHRRRYLVISLVCFAAVIIVGLVSSLTLRQPGNSGTGGISQSTQQHVLQLLAQAEIDQSAKNQTAALAAYDEVLGIEPTNDEALTEAGWLSFSAGSIDHDLTLIRYGASQSARAVTLYPNDPDPRIYYAIEAASTPGDRSVAVTQFRKFLTLSPPVTLLAVAFPWLRKLGISN